LVPRSSDVMPLDFLWCYVKSTGYGPSGQVDNIEDLKHRITAAVASATPGMLGHVWPEIKFWIIICCFNKRDYRNLLTKTLVGKLHFCVKCCYMSLPVVVLLPA
jgi:hypothetical protein